MGRSAVCDCGISCSYSLNFSADLPLHCGYLYSKLGIDARKPVFGGLRTTRAQTSLHICAVIRVLEHIICKLAAGEISIF